MAFQDDEGDFSDSDSKSSDEEDRTPIKKASRTPKSKAKKHNFDTDRGFVKLHRRNATTGRMN